MQKFRFPSMCALVKIADAGHTTRSFWRSARTLHCDWDYHRDLPQCPLTCQCHARAQHVMHDIGTHPLPVSVWEDPRHAAGPCGFPGSSA